MEGLRGIAVFLVFLVHFVTLVMPWVARDSNFILAIKALHTVGNTGVDIFFVLSGYLIYGSLIARRQQFFQYISRRVQRIYPTFIVVFSIYIVLSFVYPAESKIPAPVTTGIFYLIQNFFLLPGMFPIDPMITVAWSLSYEMFYYLLLPIVITLLGLRERGATLRMSLFLSAALAMAIYCAVNGGHIRLIMFVSGIVLYDAVKSTWIPTPHGLIGVAAFLIGIFCVLLPVDGYRGAALKSGILFVALLVLCLTCFRNPSAWIARMFSWTPLRWLGNMSYSYYLIHGLALKAGFLAFSALSPIADHGYGLFFILLPIMFFLTLIPAIALFLFIERPFSLESFGEKNRESGWFPKLPITMRR